MNRTKIEWTDYTWNPIKGICPVGCWYCYGRRMYQRFGWDPELSLDGELFGSCQDAFAPNINVYKKLERIKSGSKIFICSTCELFHPKIYKEWRDAIFQAIKEYPQHTFQILTKFPQNLDREMPDNVWLGVSITKNEDIWRVYELMNNTNIKTLKFVSFEPLLEEVLFFTKYESLDWMIIGKLTGYGNRCKPEKAWIKNMVKEARILFTPLFLKNNLKEIWGEPLIQEFPND